MSDSEKWWALVFLVLAQFMIVLDVSIMNVALPSIQREFNLTVTDLQAMVTIYTLAFGGFLLLGGRAADLYGRRLIFLCGLLGFTTVSLLIGIADSAALMVPLRAAQGFCAAFMSPAALSIVLTMFHAPEERGKALSIWGAVSAGGATAGLLLGGLLTQYLSWRWNFFVNVPVGIAVFFAALRLVPSHDAEESDRTLDLPGAALVTSGLMLAVYTLSHAHEWGWTSSFVLMGGGIALALLIAFLINEGLAKHPVMPLRFFRIGNVGAALSVQLPVTAALFAMFFFMSLYVQNLIKFTPLETGLAFLPTSLTVAISAILAPRVIARFGFKTVLTIAPLLMATGLYIFGHVAIDSTYIDFLPGLLITAVGMGMSFVSITIAATSGVLGHQSGLASGLITTAQQIGGSLGLAILSSVAAQKTADMLASSADHTPHALAPALLEGFHSAFYLGSCFAVGASIIALLFIRQRTRPNVENVLPR